MKTKSLEAKQIKNKTVLLRVDFNVPIKKGKIKDETKIIAALPTIRFLLRYKAKVIIITHLGDPKGKKNTDLSTKPLAKRLSSIIGKGHKIYFGEDLAGPKTKATIKKIKPGEIIFLENLRFDKGEENNDPVFAKKITSLAEVYINEAFSVCHRNHASVSAVKKYLPAYRGFLLDQEVKMLDRVMKPAKPLIVLMGGAKIKTKINLIKNLEKKAGKLLIGGALANTFLKARGEEIGKSFFDKDGLKIAKKLLKNKKIILPIDAVVSTDPDGKAILRKIGEVKKNEAIFDIGPETIRLYSQIIKTAKTIAWNGPLGMFEKDSFKHGTIALATLVAARSRGKIFGVVGGGETIEAINMTKMQSCVDWVSTGGGAMLSYLGGEKMPGLQ
jgi:3-phosphoglycerate kinase